MKNKTAGSFVEDIKQNRDYLLMLFPATLFFLIFNYIPMTGIVLAFKRFTYNGGIFGSPWIGIDNFKYMFLSGDLFDVTRNTILYNLAFILVNNLIEIICAIILAEIAGKLFKKLTQTLMFFPYFISWVVVGAFVYNLFNYEHGFINGLFKSLGMQQVDFYSNPIAWIFFIIAFCAWKAFGYGTVIYLAAIMGINSEMYESAEIDGASVWQRIAHITIPCIIPTIFILILLSLGNIFRGDFTMFYNLVGDNSMLWSTTDVIDTFVTRSLVQTSEIGMSAAAGLFQSFFGLIIILFFNFMVKRYESSYSLF